MVAALTQYEMIANPQLDTVPTHTGMMAYPTMGRPITKELKNIKIKTIVEMNLDGAQFIINYLKDETEKIQTSIRYYS